MTPVRWRRARQVTQAASLLSYVLLFTLTYRGAEALLPLDLFFRLDPLAGFAAMLASRTVVGALLLSALLLVVGLLLGRVWCGWLCPLGTLLDWVSPRRLYKIEKHAGWRAWKYVLLVVVLAAALLGNLSFLVLDPITLLNRTLSASFLPALNALLVGAEAFFYPYSPSQPVIDGLEAALRGTVLPSQQTYYGLGALFALVLGGVLALNWIAPHFWCRYLCPLGAVYALEARFARLRPHAVVDCNHCGQCMQVCPTGAITVTKTGFKVDAAECTLCLDCIAHCPEKVIAFQGGASAVVTPSTTPTRRQVTAGAALGIAAVALFKSAPQARREDPFAIRPPGARDNDFLAKCIRCGECVKVCPTGGLQASVFEGGLEGLWSPVLMPRLGYCDYACNACGGVCPTGAIPLLSLDDKRQKVIGQAYIDTNRCIPWATFKTCVVCQEMCPLADKAIALDELDVVAPDGKTVHLQRPRMIHDLCIGCGICEYQCPLNGPAAIRVYVPNRFPTG